MELNLAPILEQYLNQELKNASILGEYIELYGECNRGIGKSTALVHFADEFGFTVVVPLRYHKQQLTESTGYDKIIAQSEIGEQPIKTRFVFDEGVDLSNLKNLNVVTGFCKMY